ncbi:type 1 fimbrial protein [Pseudomonas sp. DTU_2021_1001937_2_SI_NGA_ILE_001]|uniref:type 1 fimbrial protein n=1 Tax=Pseudomonas sp. DTU_2021_1001937_2_SI_NGA_ILE_001 TaxID=3077589 RepID=UPI0028FC148A|nr:type 1 fimbrial protein [Pseudomonas sp. DTU_2021_1001937_2_SI_NGA_ILE_001]WNW13438.1 type 1 fimbrial protein [Pseudomonas sp. DTU_2021_1001937_2_SI_NGA_ILE_001]
MKWTLFGLGLATFTSLASVCLAAPPVGQGALRFSGSVVEASCSASSSAVGWRLDGCPTQVRPPDIHVQQMDVAALNAPSVKVKLIASDTQGRQYSQHYALVSDKGEPVTRGNYLITLTVP